MWNVLDSGVTWLTSITSAGWAAVAALFSALAAGLTWRVYHNMLLESVRPELVLLAWSRKVKGTGESSHEVIGFDRIKNVGRGAAFHIWIRASEQVGERPTAVLGTIRLPILAPGEEVILRAEIVVWWKNVESSGSGGKDLHIALKASCWDSRDHYHDTRYQLFALDPPQAVGGALELTPGVALGLRDTTIKSARRVRLRARLGRVPGVGRFFRREQ